MNEKDFVEPLFRFLLGLALYLSGEQESYKSLLESVGKQRDWFNGVPDDAAVVDKLRAFRSADGPLQTSPYAACLEKLLSFGLPSLVFTFLDQCGTFPPEVLAVEPLALIDAKASALDRDYTAAAARLEPLLASGEASREAWRLAGDCYFHLQEHERALQALQHATSFDKKFEDPAIYIRLGHVLLVKKRWKQARDSFLRSIHFQPTAEAWGGVAHAEYRSDELQMCYEALCEANFLDNERADVWAQLTLVHLRLENWDSADHCFRKCLSYNPDSDELLLEVGAEYLRRERDPVVAEAMARRSLQIRDSGQGHALLAEALFRQGQGENAVIESKVALGLLVDQPEQRRSIYDKALKWCEELRNHPLSESLHAVQRFAEQQYTERAASPP